MSWELPEYDCPGVLISPLGQVDLEEPIVSDVTRDPHLLQEEPSSPYLSDCVQKSSYSRKHASLTLTLLGAPQLSAVIKVIFWPSYDIFLTFQFSMYLEPKWRWKCYLFLVPNREKIPKPLLSITFPSNPSSFQVYQKYPQAFRVIIFMIIHFSQLTTW